MTKKEEIKTTTKKRKRKHTKRTRCVWNGERNTHRTRYTVDKCVLMYIYSKLFTDFCGCAYSLKCTANVRPKQIGKRNGQLNDTKNSVYSLAHRPDRLLPTDIHSFLLLLCIYFSFISFGISVLSVLHGIRFNSIITYEAKIIWLLSVLECTMRCDAMASISYICFFFFQIGVEFIRCLKMRSLNSLLYVFHTCAFHLSLSQSSLFCSSFGISCFVILHTNTIQFNIVLHIEKVCTH